jgi:hypothetical protein
MNLLDSPEDPNEMMSLILQRYGVFKPVLELETEDYFKMTLVCESLVEAMIVQWYTNEEWRQIEKEINLKMRSYIEDKLR